MDLERTTQSLKLVLGFLEDNYRLDLAKELRKTKRKLALWRQGCCKPKKGYLYDFGRELIDSLGIDPNEIPSALRFDRKVIGLQLDDHREPVPLFIFHPVGLSNPRPDIQYYLGVDDLKYLYTYSDDDQYTTFDYTIPCSNDGGCYLLVKIQTHDGDIIHIPASELTTIEQIWNAVAKRTHKKSFDLFVDNQIVERGTLVGNLKLEKPLVQKLIE